MIEDKNPRGNDPSKVYEDELKGRGRFDLFDNEEESAARDQAKIDKARLGRGQKMDVSSPSDKNEKKTTRIDPDREMEENG